MNVHGCLALVLVGLVMSQSVEALLQVTPPTGEVIANEYIAVLHQNATDAVLDTIGLELGGAKFKIGDFRAVHASLSTAKLAWLLTQTAAVQLVEHNQVIKADNNVPCPSQQPEPLSWGQKRTTSGSTVMFAHDPQWGSGVDVYVIDTGIRCSHREFENRCIWGTNTAGGSEADMNGHGTHVAGTIGGARYGIAKKATLIAVKVLGDDGAGTTAGVISGVQWSTQNSRSRGRPSLANMSLGGGYSVALNAAVNAAVRNGMSFAVAAGNENIDACATSPASASDAVTVGSIQQGDQRSGFSNFGKCLDIFAPGSGITAAYIGSDTDYKSLSGTSMASPHVAGAMAAYLTGKLPTPFPAEVTRWLRDSALSDAVRNEGPGSPNYLLQVRCTGSPPGNGGPSPILGLPVGSTPAPDDSSPSDSGATAAPFLALLGLLLLLLA